MLSFDCRDNSQNKSLHLIYNENPEVEFISKYSKHDTHNCFLDLDTKIRNLSFYFSWNINKAYTFVQHLEKDGVNSVKVLACKKQTMVRVSSRYISSKPLINANISLASFIYDCIDTFCFPNEETSPIYTRRKIIKVLPYLLTTDTDSGSLEFIVIKEDSCDCGEQELRDILLRIFLDNNMQHRMDLSGEFLAQEMKLYINRLVFTNSRTLSTESSVPFALTPRSTSNSIEYIMKPTRNTRV